MKRFLVGAAAIAVAAAGCKGEASGPSTRQMTPAERQALIATLTNSPQMGQFGPVASAALLYVNEVGQMQLTTGPTTAAYTAVGLWMDINATVSGAPLVTQFFTVLAWQGTGSSISKISLVLGAGNTAPSTATLGPTFSGTTGGTAMFGDAPFSSGDVYVSTSGTFAVSAVSFVGPTAFSLGTLTGTYAPGTLMGSFSLTAMNGSGSSSSQSADFSAGIPAVRVVVNGSI